MRYTVVALALLAALAAPAAAQSKPTEANMAQLDIGDGRVSFDLRARTLSDVVEFIRGKTKVNIILSNDIVPESRVLFYRDVVERAQEIASFLRYDSDPYIVVGDDGKLYWILDAYTVSSLYPYSRPAPPGSAVRPVP